MRVTKSIPASQIRIASQKRPAPANAIAMSANGKSLRDLRPELSFVREEAHDHDADDVRLTRGISL
jgi:hypothetical protein